MLRLSLLRKELKLSQFELAERLGVSQQTISKYENGTREPDNNTLKLLSDFFGVSTDYLLGTTDIREKPDDFVRQAKEKFGYRGKRQAEEIIDDIQALFAGGELPTEDKDKFFDAIKTIYWEIKEENKKYGRKKLKSNNN